MVGISLIDVRFTGLHQCERIRESGAMEREDYP